MVIFLWLVHDGLEHTPTDLRDAPSAASATGSDPGMTDNAAVAQQPPTATLEGADEQARTFNRQLREVITAFTGWNVWHSDTGSLYATLQRRLKDDEIEAGLSATVAADSPAELIDLIHQQNQLALEKPRQQPEGSDHGRTTDS